MQVLSNLRLSFKWKVDVLGVKLYGSLNRWRFHHAALCVSLEGCVRAACQINPNGAGKRGGRYTQTNSVLHMLHGGQETPPQSSLQGICEFPLNSFFYVCLRV